MKVSEDAMPLGRSLEGIVPGIAPGGQLVVWGRDRTLADAWAGRSGDADEGEVAAATRFDLASVTKLFTAVAFMRLVERGLIGLDDPVWQRLSAISAQPRAQRITWRHLLSHSSGLPAGVELTTASDAEEARQIVLATVPTDEPGELVRYSDVGFMLLGFGLEVISGQRLASVIKEAVTTPLGLEETSFRADSEQTAATEFCNWRQRRLQGEVHDENAAALGGVAGHAGLFGTARDVAKLGRCLLRGGAPILTPATVAEMVREQARSGDVRRGLGVALWSPDPEATSHQLGRRAFGHTGFTGTSLWVDPDADLVISLLTNTVYRGREDRGFSAARIALHRRVVDAWPASVGYGGS